MIRTFFGSLALTALLGLFSRRAEGEPTAADKLKGVERAIEAAREKRARLVADGEQTQVALAAIDDERRALVLQAKADGDAAAQRQLAALNTRRAEHESTTRDIDDAIVQLDAMMPRLTDELRAAERAQAEECVAKLCTEQATLADAIDAALAAAGKDISRWCELDALVRDHAGKLGVSSGRGIESRLGDALSGALYEALPRTFQIGGIELSLNITSARRRASFASLSAVKGPAGQIVRAAAATMTTKENTKEG